MKKLSKLIAAFCTAFLFAVHLLASPVAKDSIFPLMSYIHYGEEQGLTTKTVYSIIQDNEGFIWMGTDAGAFRFDGNKFKRFTTKDGLTDNEVLRIYKDRFNRIWFLTFNGHLSFWKEGKIYNPANMPFLKDAYTGGTIRSADEDTQGRLWLGTEKKGFILIDGNDVKIIEIIHKEMDSNPFYIHVDAKGDIWSYFKTGGMFKVLEKNFLDTIYLPSTQMNYCCYVKDKQETYYISPEGVFKIKDRVISPYIKNTELPSFKRMRNIIVQGDTTWICSNEEGCYEYKNEKFIKRYLENVSVTLVLKDREGNLWFGVVDKGVFMLPMANNLVTGFTQSTGLSGEKALSIACGKNNSFWIGYNNATVDYISDNRKKTYKLAIPDNSIFRVTSLLIDSDKTWCGTDVGTFLIQNEKVSYIMVLAEDGSKLQFSVKRLFKDSENRIYCASNGNLMQIVSGKTGYYAKNLLDQSVRTFSGIEYKRNDFIVSCMTGLLEYIPGRKNIEYKTDVDFSSTRVLDMKSDKQTIVLATSDGIYTLKDGKIIQHFSQATGMSDNYCNKVYISGNYMYVSTSNGLDILEKKGAVWNISEVKTIQNGLLSNSINDVVVNNENIYVATNDGLSVIKKTDTVPDIYVGRVSVTELATDSTFTVFGNNYSFKADIPRLVIRFAYPVFNPVNNARIQYRLLQNPADNPQWHHSQNNSVEFSSLNPGSYIFQLKPDIKKENNSIITNFYFKIEPLWWQTTPAKFFFGFVIICFVALFFVQRTKRRYELRVASLKQMSMLDRERSRIASDMHDDIGADLTQISMMANIVKVSKDKPEQVIAKIAQTSNEVLTKIDTIIWTLDSTHDHLPDLIYFINERMSNYLEVSGINFLFETEGEIPDYKIDATKRRNVFLVIKELVHNSLKHSNASTIEIKVHYKNSQLRIAYKENGKGYAISEVIPGLGHTTMKKRMEEIDSTFDLSSAPGQGVIANLIIPVAEDKIM